MRRLLHAVTESRANYRASFAIELACPIGLAWIGTQSARGWLAPLACVAAGLLVFSFIEYAIHRWLFHAPDGVMSAIHRTHHESPHGHTALPCITSVVVASIGWLALAPLVGAMAASFFLSGVLGGYSYYSILHHLEHRLRINTMPFRWLQKRWADHSVHHRLAETNFGVTTSLWDHVFATHYLARKR
jgi:sterol desaturase/sphingolipid hydroxylase (fatty acid hydroxylase superfamily)